MAWIKSGKKETDALNPLKQTKMSHLKTEPQRRYFSFLRGTAKTHENDIFIVLKHSNATLTGSPTAEDHVWTKVKYCAPRRHSHTGDENITPSNTSE